METWEEIRAALDALLRLMAVGVLAALGLAVRAILPHLPALALAAVQALREWITTRAMARWTGRAQEAAAAILDPANPATSVAAEASKMLKGIPDAVASLGGTKDAAQAAIERQVSVLRGIPPQLPRSLSAHELALASAPNVTAIGRPT